MNLTVELSEEYFDSELDFIEISCLYQCTYIFVISQSHNFAFSERSFGKRAILKWIVQFLDSNILL